MRPQRNLEHEMHLQAIAIGLRVGGVITAGLAAYSLRNEAELAAAVKAQPMIAAPLAIGVAVFGVGQGLAQLFQWARVAAILLCLAPPAFVARALQAKETPKLAAYALAVYAVAVLVELLSPRAGALFVPEYRAEVELSPGLRPAAYRSFFFFVPLVVAVALVVPLIQSGWRPR